MTGPDLGLADALATALAVAGEPGLAFIEPLEGYEAYIINADSGRRRVDANSVVAAPGRWWSCHRRAASPGLMRGVAYRAYGGRRSSPA